MRDREIKMSYMTKEDAESLALKRTMPEVFAFAIEVLDRMPQPVRWIAGPITSGTRTAKENRLRLRDTIFSYRENGIVAFNYLPFRVRAMQILSREPVEKTVWDLTKKRSSQSLVWLSKTFHLHWLFGDRFFEDEDVILQQRLLEELYLPLFKSGKIRKLLIMPGSEASLNVQGLRSFAIAEDIPIGIIPERLIPKILE